MRVRFLAPARTDLREAVRYYDDQRAGLGTEFWQEVRAAVERIRNFPDGWHPFGPNTRRCLVRRFPYGVIYHLRDDEILVIAVAHLRREPVHWQDRP